MVYLGPLKCDFKKSSRVTQKSTTQTIFSILLKINISCVEFLNCFAMKFLTNLTEYCILKYHKYHNIIQLLSHYTKSILKSLINHLPPSSNHLITHSLTSSLIQSFHLSLTSSNTLTHSITHYLTHSLTFMQFN